MKEESHIGNYKLDKTIGSGTFGKVKIGTHLITLEKVAVKVLEKSKITQLEDIERVKREIKFLKKLNHTNVIKLLEILEDDNYIYMVMEYAGGGELFNHIVKKRRLNEYEASFFFYQLVEGLDSIHKHSIVHRDLKPENLLFNEHKQLKIIDFGLSNNYIEGSSLLSTPCGSPCYAAPEMVLGQKYSGVKVDTWSIGIILFAMTSGYLPFEDQNNEKLFKKIVKCNLEFPNYVTQNSIDMIYAILDTNPDTRIKLNEIKNHPFYLQGKNLYLKHMRNRYSEIYSSLTINSKNESKFSFIESLGDPIANKNFYFSIRKQSEFLVKKFVVQKMINEYKYSKEEISANLEGNRHNTITSTYSLLVNKYINDIYLVEVLFDQEERKLSMENEALSLTGKLSNYQSENKLNSIDNSNALKENENNLSEKDINKKDNKNCDNCTLNNDSKHIDKVKHTSNFKSDNIVNINNNYITSSCNNNYVINSNKVVVNVSNTIDNKDENTLNIKNPALNKFNKNDPYCPVTTDYNSTNMKYNKSNLVKLNKTNIQKDEHIKDNTVFNKYYSKHCNTLNCNILNSSKANRDNAFNKAYNKFDIKAISNINNKNNDIIKKNSFSINSKAIKQNSNSSRDNHNKKSIINSKDKITYINNINSSTNNSKTMSKNSKSIIEYSKEKAYNKIIKTKTNIKKKNLNSSDNNTIDYNKDLNRINNNDKNKTIDSINNKNNIINKKISVNEVISKKIDLSNSSNLNSNNIKHLETSTNKNKASGFNLNSNIFNYYSNSKVPLNTSYHKKATGSYNISKRDKANIDNENSNLVVNNSNVAKSNTPKHNCYVSNSSSSISKLNSNNKTNKVNNSNFNQKQTTISLTSNSGIEFFKKAKESKNNTDYFNKPVIVKDSNNNSNLNTLSNVDKIFSNKSLNKKKTIDINLIGNKKLNINITKNINKMAVKDLNNILNKTNLNTIDNTINNNNNNNNNNTHNNISNITSNKYNKKSYLNLTNTITPKQYNNNMCNTIISNNIKSTIANTTTYLNTDNNLIYTNKNYPNYEGSNPVNLLKMNIRHNPKIKGKFYNNKNSHSKSNHKVNNNESSIRDHSKSILNIEKLKNDILNTKERIKNISTIDYNNRPIKISKDKSVNFKDKFNFKDMSHLKTDLINSNNIHLKTCKNNIFDKNVLNLNTNSFDLNTNCLNNLNSYLLNKNNKQINKSIKHSTNNSNIPYPISVKNTISKNKNKSINNKHNTSTINNSNYNNLKSIDFEESSKFKYNNINKSNVLVINPSSYKNISNIKSKVANSNIINNINKKEYTFNIKNLENKIASIKAKTIK